MCKSIFILFLIIQIVYCVPKVDHQNTTTTTTTTTAASIDDDSVPTTTFATATNNLTDDFTGELGNRLRLVPLTDSINNFGFELARKLNNNTDQSNKNLAFSPLSIGQIFSTIVSSAHNETRDELMNVFGFADQLQTAENVNNAFRLLLDDYDKAKLEETKRAIKLSYASIALYATDFNIKKSFRKTLKEIYRTDATKVDFSNSEGVDIINNFVKDSTNGLITKLIEKLNPETKLALINAFYFKGDWTKKFSTNQVKDRAFHNSDKSNSQVKTMFKRDEFHYYEDKDVQAITLPYSGNASMTILLPQKEKSIDDLLNNLSSNQLDKYRSQMKEHQVELYLPKFKIESSYDLKDPMASLGVKKIFSRDADLSGISSANVFVSEAVHKAFVEVNEEGTKAAASTGLGIMTKSFGRNLKRMQIDRPFLFLIHDELNNVVLFLGAVKKL